MKLILGIILPMIPNIHLPPKLLPRRSNAISAPSATPYAKSLPLPPSEVALSVEKTSLKLIKTR